MLALRLGPAFLLLLSYCCPASLGQSAAPAGCPPCAPAECPVLPPRRCPLGKVRDSCGCCWRCARGEGEACAPGALGGGAADLGRCASGLECRRRTKGRAVGVCVCKSRYPVCGSDGLTYPSPCQLRAASLRAESRGERPVGQRSKGPCEQGTPAVCARSGGEGRSERRGAARIASSLWVTEPEVRACSPPWASLASAVSERAGIGRNTAILPDV
ncbi:Insulin-like growth factor-binding protein 7 [Varanus komodoensis]|nr:Insulin-like growth factor-binding protein 7 [Varanus komodoensis]